jgi:hypothetical protein
MTAGGTSAARMLARLTSAGESAVASGKVRLTQTLGGAARARVILLLAGVLGLSSADVATVGAFTRDLITALPYLIAAAFCLSAQNPPIDAARLDIMPAPLWGRAESIRTVLRSFAQAAAPLLFGAVADHVLLPSGRR